ncbi:TPR repeat-containing protein YrrB [Phycisphaerae bacterium RAS1]|nr:TPR repeat-containing protein YrrB [Phycisphaerae bacterium RAS1]
MPRSSNKQPGTRARIALDSTDSAPRHPFGGASLVCLSIAIAVVVLLAFFPSLSNGFNFDDDENLERNPAYRGLRLSNLQWMFTTFHMGHYQPLSWVTLALDYQMWGMNPRGYHATNLLLHSANAVLVFWLALRLLAPSEPAGSRLKHPTGWKPIPQDLKPVSRGWRAGPPDWRRVSAAGLAALLFALHPLRVESVTWITERRDVLSSFFLLATLLVYLRAVEPRQTRTGLLMATALVLYTLSLLSRAMGMTLPAILLLLDWHPLRRIGGAAGFASPAARRVYLEKLPFLLPAIAAAIIAPIAQAQTGAAVSMESHSVPSRVLQACYGLFFYLWATIWPVGLSPLYELVRVPGQLPAHHIAAALFVVAAGAGIAWLGRRRPAIAVAALVYAVLLGPVLGLAQSGKQEVADRYSYLPAISLSILATSALRAGARSALERPATWVAAGVVLSACSALTWRQTQVWRDGETLWRHAVRCQPDSPTAHQFLGVSLARLGRHGEALGSFQRALEIAPNHRGAAVGLAKSLSESGRWEPAEAAWRRAVELRPGEWEPVQYLANALMMREKLEEAVILFRRAGELDPRQSATWLNLCATLLRLGRAEEAVAAATRATQVSPGSADGPYNLGNALAAAGRLEEALGAYRAAQAFNPQLVEARVNCGFTLDRLGRTSEAIDVYRDAIRTDARRVEPRMNLADLLLRLGRREEAVAELEATLRIRPDFEPARTALEALRGSGGE